MRCELRFSAILITGGSLELAVRPSLENSFGSFETWRSGFQEIRDSGLIF
jgi:hypothetical protein